jgi:hypothetical protein
MVMTMTRSSRALISIIALFAAGGAVAAEDPVPVLAPGDLVAAALAVDGTAGPSANGNGVLEVGETAQVSPSWRNASTIALTVTGSDTGVTGPGVPTMTYAVTDHAADYGTIPAGTIQSCTASANCYAVQVGPPISRPQPHWDAVFGERLVEGTARTWLLHVGDSFGDVPRTSPFYRFVETLFHAGVSGGCGAAAYCPASPASRQEMAVFALASKEGRFFAPRQCLDGSTAFGDVPAGSPFCPWVEELARRGVVGGCGGGLFCPAAPVSREQMAVFTLLTREGSGYAPPACVAGAERFTDVPAGSPFCRWIEELARRGVVGGCAADRYCPTDPVTREQMSVFLSRTFDLQLYGPTPAVQVVTNSGDAGGDCTPAGCSLRAAITAANATANPPGPRDEIRFLIPGPGVHTIAPLSVLPNITSPVVVDGYSQPGARPNSRPTPEGLDGVLRVEINGATAGSTTLLVRAPDVLLRGLVVNRAPNVGIRFDDVSGGTVEGCYIGTDAAGGTDLGNGSSGITLFLAHNVLVGGTRPAARNLIAGNAVDIGIHGQRNRVQGNLIGTNAAGTAALADATGIFIRGAGHQLQANDNVIGGAEPGVLNVIAGMQGAAIALDGIIGDNLVLAINNRIYANFIGNNGRGTLLPNAAGVAISGGGAVTSTHIGGPPPGFPLGNLLRGNGTAVIDGGMGTFVQGNLISGNSLGVDIRLGGATVTGNVISLNTGSGVHVQPAASRVLVQANNFSANGQLGIDLAPAGVNANDGGDGDGGANLGQNHPVLTLAQLVSGGVRVAGTLNSSASRTFTIEVFVSAAADPSGFGEGEAFLGRFPVTTDAAGNASFNLVLSGPVAAGQPLSATATDDLGNTSEFSAVRAATN